MKFLFLSSAAFTLAICAPAAADPMPAAMAKPLLAAERDLAAHKFTAARAELGIADAQPNKTPEESLDIAQLRAAIDTAAGNTAAASADYQALIATGQLPPAQVAQMAGAEAGADYRAGSYAAAAATIKAYLPNDPQFFPILLQSYEQLGQCDALNQALAPALRRAARGYPAPPESQLQMLAYCYGTAKNTSGYVAALKLLITYDPNPSYWASLLGQLQVQPEFSDRLGLDFFRLKLAAGVPATEADDMSYTQEALQAGLPNEAAKIFAAGTAAGMLGTGADLDRQNRLKALVAQKQAQGPAALQAAIAAKDEPALFEAGFNEVEGGNNAGLQLMADAIRSGALTQPGQAELEMGMAYSIAGQKANAAAMWRNVQGGDGAAELAALWLDVR